MSDINNKETSANVSPIDGDQDEIQALPDRLVDARLDAVAAGVGTGMGTGKVALQDFHFVIENGR